jgi:hypothetical protein
MFAADLPEPKGMWLVIGDSSVSHATMAMPGFSHAGDGAERPVTAR